MGGCNHKIGGKKQVILVDFRLFSHEGDYNSSYQSHFQYWQYRLAERVIQIEKARNLYSEAKLSFLQELERENLIKRVKKGKTLEIYLKV